ncbi:hypothetical protein [Mucilaginibacter paludis]|uniref:Uncharacterized protein n=1 Tax=Mucilaginibacter paludis DSM 18603 TaxID=714943 RepID=H1Y0S9_9SPHI|nr:hypothetical protein [Mucilaginibacter paludis]EHQ28819.1 hypothetical protein Mucpa_4734 [Mucilaginibacter paludis DSM 18603]
MKMRSLGIGLIICLGIAGCKKVEDSQSTGIVLLSQVTHTNGSTTDVSTFKYDDQNHLIEYNDGFTKRDHKYIYDSKDRITEADSYGQVSATPVKDTFTYPDDNTVTMTETGQPSLPANSTPTVFTLNDKKQPVKMLFGNGAGDYSLYTYDDRGNLLTEIGYLNVTTTTLPSMKVTYVYDQNKSYFSNVKGSLFLLFGLAFVNNFTNQTAYDLGHTNGLTHYSNGTFEYNSQGYPVKETRLVTSTANTDVVTDIYTYTYISK